MKNYIDEFIYYVLVWKKASSHTIEAYQRDLMLLEKNFPSTTLEKLSSENLRSVSHKLREKRLSNASIARIHCSWRTFYRYLEHNKIISSNPTADLPRSRVSPKLSESLSVDSIYYFINRFKQEFIQPYPEGSKRWIVGVRDLCIIEIFYSSGLRLSEILYLKLSPYPAIDLSSQLIKVHGKGKQERIVPLGEYAYQALKIWLSFRENLLHTDTNSSAYFISQAGNPLHPRTIQKKLQNLSYLLPQKQRIYPHLLRHSCASHLLESSDDLRAVQEILGHRSLNSTQVYTRLDLQTLIRAYEMTHPKAKKK